MTVVSKVDHNETDELVHRLADHILQSGWKPTQIVSVGRGGMIPTRLLSDRLNVKAVELLPVTRYEGMEGREVRLQPSHLDRVAPGALLVDDVADKGDTLIAVSTALRADPRYQGEGAVRFAVLHWKQGCRFVPDFIGRKVNGMWIQYPWETTESLSLLIPEGRGGD